MDIGFSGWWPGPTDRFGGMITGFPPNIQAIEMERSNQALFQLSTVTTVVLPHPAQKITAVNPHVFYTYFLWGGNSIQVFHVSVSDWSLRGSCGKFVSDRVGVWELQGGYNWDGRWSCHALQRSVGARDSGQPENVFSDGLHVIVRPLGPTIQIFHCLTRVTYFPFFFFK